MYKKAAIFIILSLSFTSCIFAQNTYNSLHAVNTNNDNTSSEIRLPKENKPDISIEKNDNASSYSDILMHQYTNIVFHPPKAQTEPITHTIVSSVNSNIHFGGFWDKYAIINFTPQLDITPFDFIRIYANNVSSIYVPIKEIKTYFRSLAVKSAAVVAIENSVRFVFNSFPMMQSMVGFVLKNIVMTLLNKTENNSTSPPEFKNYYCAVNIRF